MWMADRIRALPDDGLRHEVVAGEHLVTPSPRAPHEVAVSEIEALLRPYVRASFGSSRYEKLLSKLSLWS